MVNFDLNAHQIQHIHFIGIGGISMSAIAEMLLSFNYKVSGSDLRSSKITNRLQAKGAEVIIGHSRENIKDCDLVVYTAAIKEENPELERARQTGIPVIDRAEMLGLLMKKFETSIAVAGTHGKTTTTSMISLILEHAGFEPTILVGGELDEIGGNIKIGKDQYLVTEACEYVESFLKFFPKIGIVLNIDADHLDYFKDIDHILEAFVKFAQLIPQEGFLIACADDLHTEAFIDKVHCPIVTYGIKKEGDYQAKNIQFSPQGFPGFDVYYKGEFLGEFQLSVPGNHNISNSLAAIACCHLLDVPLKRMQEKLGSFQGTHRRFEKLGEINGLTIIDDYAHHPTEIKATLQAATQYPHHKVWCIFQPHTYTRTITLLEDFAEAFGDADQVIIADIYAAREKDTGVIHARDLAKAIEAHQQNILYISGFQEITNYIMTHAEPGDLIITMGAGDIHRVGEMLLEKN